ncbi:MAG: hypothetical protein K8S54_06055 [Spirochaetia bacterium]|nr:hypothetical protein [Spirochaetia bacterium]
MPDECRLSASDCHYPFPDDRWMQKSDRSPTGRIWRNKDKEGYTGLWAIARADGFSPDSHIWVETPCEVTGTFPMRMAGSADAFLLWNSSTEKSAPMLVRLHRGELCLFEVIPEHILRPGDVYLLIIRDLRDKKGRALELSRTFEERDAREAIFAERNQAVPGFVNRYAIQTIVQVTVRSFENLLGPLLHLRNSVLAYTEGEDLTPDITEVTRTGNELMVHGTVSLPLLCENDLFGHCRFKPDASGKIEYNRSTVKRPFFVRLPSSSVERGLFIPAGSFHDALNAASISGSEKIMRESKTALFGFRDQQTFLDSNLKPLQGLSSPIPGFALGASDQNRLTAMPDRDAVRIIHGILLTRMMQIRFSQSLNSKYHTNVHISRLNGLALEQEKDALALAMNPFIRSLVIIHSEPIKRAPPFGQAGSFPEKEYVHLFWDGLHFPNYEPLLRERKAIPDTPTQKILRVQSILFKEDLETIVNFLRER